MDNSTDYMRARTKGNSSPQGKPRVYFTCHPADFDKYFDRVCEDIFKTHDCAIYYTADMTAPIPEIYRATDLGSMNLFVMPVTWRLLSEPNRAMDSDFPFADEKHYPVLPLMMESGIDEFYQKKFGKRQYLSPYSHDLTEIRYEEKLKKYLSAILIDDETAERVRAAFDAYIFLSYRKKDRHHANELMRLIHENPKYRDVAIWYDEYLTPGENFDDVIRKAMDKSELFTLLVTPNLVNEENYVHTTEYPEAKKAEKRILPAEMVATDREELSRQYEDVPPCIDARKRDELDAGLLAALKDIAVQENDDDPEHNYLIGLAYLEGIDVETNVERGLALITSAAEAELPEAMEKLFNLYYEGSKVTVDYTQALHWAQLLTIHYAHFEGAATLDAEALTWTLTWINNQIFIYIKLGSKSDCEIALDLCETCYALCCEIGEDNPLALTFLSNLSLTYFQLGSYEKALELSEKCYALNRKTCGKKDPNTLRSLNNLAMSYFESGNYEKALKLTEKCYALSYEVLGGKHPDTLNALLNLASTYRMSGKSEKSLGLAETGYALECEVLGEKHPNTLVSLISLSEAYRALDNYEKALELSEKGYALLCEVQGEKHPNTLVSLISLSEAYRALGNYEKALELSEKGYALLCEVQGKHHSNTLVSLNALANAYYCGGNYKKALELHEKVYALFCETFSNRHPHALTALGSIASEHYKLGHHEKALELKKEVHTLSCGALGKEHPLSQYALKEIILLCWNINYMNTMLVYCQNVSASDYSLIPDLAEVVAQVYEAIQFPKKAEEIRARKATNQSNDQGGQ